MVQFLAMKTILFLQTANSPSNQAELAGAIRAAKAFGWQIRVIEFSGSTPSRGKQDSGMSGLLKDVNRLRSFWSPLGIIVDCGGLSSRPRKNLFRLPTVFLDKHPSNLWKGAVSVYTDDLALGQTAARELLSLNAKTYAYAPFTSEKIWSVNRGKAFADAIKLNHSQCQVFKKRHRKDIYIIALDSWISALPKPVAIFAANDHISEMVIDSSIRNGFNVPGDVSVIGVDNDEQICLRSTPTLSSIKPDHEKAGALSVQLLKVLIQNPRRPPAPMSFGLAAVLHRGSTRPFRRHDERTMQLLRTIREKATTGLSVAQLVTGFGASRRTMEMQFREATGKSILQEIQDLRIEQAKLMLTQTSASMDEVANSSGFPSTQAFRKYFTKSIGLSPLAFRQRSKTSTI